MVRGPTAGTEEATAETEEVSAEADVGLEREIYAVTFGALIPAANVWEEI